MSFAHQIKLIILGLLLFPAALFAQTSTTGRVDEGPLAGRPTVCSPGDYYVTTDTNPVVEYKCSIGNSWNAEAGGGGGAPGGNNGDTQCKSGAVFVACSQNSAVLYVSTTGNDTNSGKSWDTAKLTIYGALIALPSGSASPATAGNGTVFITDGVSANPTANAGIWMLGSSDPNFASPPAGWVRQNSGTLKIQGVGCQSFTSNNTGSKCLVNVGNGPGIWISGTNGGLTEFNNIQIQYPTKIIALGISSTGNRAVGGAQNIRFTNVGGNVNIVGGNGPGVDIGNNVFNIYFDKSGFGGNSAETATISSLSRTSNVTTVTTSAVNPFTNGENCGIIQATDTSFNGSYRGITFISTTQFSVPNSGPNATSSGGFVVCDRSMPVVIDPTAAASGSGLIWFKDTELNGGGIRVWGGTGGATVYVNGLLTEGDFVHATGAAIWPGGAIGSQGLIIARDVQVADTVGSPNYILQNDSNLGPGQVLLEGCLTNAFCAAGAATFIGANNSTSPYRQGQAGFNAERIIGETDVQRSAPQSVRFPNFAFTPPASWTLSGGAVAAVTDRDGSTLAGDLTSGSGTQQVYFGPTPSAPNGFPAGSLAAGDFILCGVWLRTPGATPIGSGNMQCQPLGLTSINYSFTLGDINIYTDNEWEWVWTLFKIKSLTGTATSFAFDAQFSPTIEVQAYNPLLIRIPAGTLSDADAVALAIYARGYSSACSVGQYCDQLGPVLHPTAAVANAVTDWATSTSLGSIVGNITGQLLTAQNAAPANFLSPGITDGNGGSPVTTTPYTIQCDSGTTLLDRAHFLRFQVGSSIVTVPSSTASGCTGSFVVTVVDEAVTTLTFNSTSLDTFSIYDGGTVTTGATSFILSTGQYATLSQGATNVWEVRKTNGGVGSTASPVMAWYFGPQCPSANTGQCFFTPANTQLANDCTWTTSSTTVTCATSHFVPSDVGKRVAGYITTGVPGGTIFGCVSGRTTFSPLTTGVVTISTYTSGTQISVSATPLNAATSNHGCFIWGTPDDSNAAALEAAYSAVSSYCPRLEIASSMYWFSSPHFFSQPTGCANIPSLTGASTTFGNMVYTAGFELEGRGPGNTIITLGPDFPAAGGNLCTNSLGNMSGNVCFMVPVEGKWKNLQINGGGQYQCNSGTNGKILLGVSVGTLENVTLNNMCWQGTSTGASSGPVGIGADYLAQLYQVNSSGWGNVCVQVPNGATPVQLAQAFKLACNNNGGDGNFTTSLDVVGAGSSAPAFTCWGCILAGQINQTPNGANVVNVAVGNTVFLYGTDVSNCDSGTVGVCTTGGTALFNNAGNLHLDGISTQAFGGGSTPVQGLTCAASTGVFYIHNSSILSNSLASLRDTHGCTIYDTGGNNGVFSGLGTTAANYSTSYVADGHMLMFSCTGVANSSVTNSLYGSGPNVTATTCAGQTATLGAGIPFQQARTIQGINCTSSATTVSVACTVLVNGSTTSTPTCTMTAATHCIDFSHALAVNPGDLLSVKIVTGAAETGANIKMQVIWQ